MGIGALIGASLISSIIGMGAQHASNAVTRNFNAQEAQKQRDFEERMSSTAYTRAIEDIENAGLNPSMLYANGGSGQASTPSSASASTTTPNSMFMVGQVGELINSINNARALDMKYNQKNVTTTRMFNDAGELVRALVQTRE